MTEVEKLAQFVELARFEDLSENAIEQLKIRILDSLGVAIGALGAEPIEFIQETLHELGGNPHSTLIGGNKTSPDRAAFYNGALVRYLDFNDSFLSKGETCHPSDNIAPVLAAAEFRHASGKDLLTALAVAYQVHIRLSEVAPVRASGFDHTTQGAYAVAAGVSKALGLDAQKIANAIAMSGTANNALRVTRTGSLSHWKGLAYPHVAFSGTHCAFLAMHGMTGPIEVFEGNKGFKESIAGHFEMNWQGENLEGVCRTILKKYNAEIHSQSTLEAILDLKQQYGFLDAEVERIEIDIFKVAYDIIGGGEEGDKTLVCTKEEADHSLPYLVAVALLDGTVLPRQYDPKRIIQNDVQNLLRRVRILPQPDLSLRFPNEMPTRVRVHLKEGQLLELERSDYEGFTTRPMSWSQVESKMRLLTEPYRDQMQRESIIEAVKNLENIQVSDLVSLLANFNLEQWRRSA